MSGTCNSKPSRECAPSTFGRLVTPGCPFTEVMTSSVDTDREILGAPREQFRVRGETLASRRARFVQHVLAECGHERPREFRIAQDRGELLRDHLDNRL